MSLSELENKQIEAIYTAHFLGKIDGVDWSTIPMKFKFDKSLEIGTKINAVSKQWFDVICKQLKTEKFQYTFVWSAASAYVGRCDPPTLKFEIDSNTYGDLGFAMMICDD